MSVEVSCFFSWHWLTQVSLGSSPPQLLFDFLFLQLMCSNVDLWLWRKVYQHLHFGDASRLQHSFFARHFTWGGYPRQVMWGRNFCHSCLMLWPGLLVGCKRLWRRDAEPVDVESHFCAVRVWAGGRLALGNFSVVWRHGWDEMWHVHRYVSCFDLKMVWPCAIWPAQPSEWVLEMLSLM